MSKHNIRYRLEQLMADAPAPPPTLPERILKILKIKAQERGAEWPAWKDLEWMKHRLEEIHKQRKTQGD
jgi:hypothetical protein